MADVNGKPQSYLPEDTKCEFVLISTEDFPRLQLYFGGKHKNRKEEEIDAESFIAVKGFKAKGKRLSGYEIRKVEEMEPLRIKEKEEEEILEIVEGEVNEPEVIEEVVEDIDEDISKADEVEFIIEPKTQEPLVDDAMDEDEPSGNQENQAKKGQQMTLEF